MTMGVIAIAGILGRWPASSRRNAEILYRTFTSPNPIGKLLWVVGLVTAGMTSFYMFRLWYKTFFGELRFDPNEAFAAWVNDSGHDEGQADHAHGHS